MKLPDSVLAMVEMHPIEDLLLPVVRDAIPDVETVSLVPKKANLFPLILLRAYYNSASWHGDERFFDTVMVSVHTFTEDPDGDQAGALLSEAVRVALRDAARAKKKVDGIGSLHSVKMTSRPRRVTDWATSTGPVQYADLPSGTYRYETIYRVTFRRPLP